LNAVKLLNLSFWDFRSWLGSTGVITQAATVFRGETYSEQQGFRVSLEVGGGGGRGRGGAG
jgi:hypothetical protein